MKTLAYVVSWIGLAAGIMLVVGGLLRVQVREADDGYGDPFREAAIELLDGVSIEPRPEYRLGVAHVVIGSGIMVLSLPGVLFSLRQRGG